MGEWYYAKDDERIGPVSEDALRSLLADGRVSHSAMVWTQGLPAWVRASESRLLAAVQVATIAAQPVQTISAVQPLGAAPVSPAQVSPFQSLPAGTMQVSYFTPAGNLPPRAERNLRGHAAPQGDIGDWPLDDARFTQFEETVRLRKAVTGAAALYRALLLLGIISTAIFFMVAIVDVLNSRRNSQNGFIGLMIMAGVMLGISALYFFTFRATMRAQRWAPLTMFIFYLAGIAVSVLTTLINMDSLLAGPSVVMLIIILIFGGAFAIVSWRSFAAIPRYLQQPAWCQELLVKAKL